MKSKRTLGLGFPELPGLGLRVFTSVPHLVLDDLNWILKLYCRDWREMSSPFLQVCIFFCIGCSSSVSLVS